MHIVANKHYFDAKRALPNLVPRAFSMSWGKGKGPACSIFFHHSPGLEKSFKQLSDEVFVITLTDPLIFLDITKTKPVLLYIERN